MEHPWLEFHRRMENKSRAFRLGFILAAIAAVIAHAWRKVWLWAIVLFWGLVVLLFAFYISTIAQSILVPLTSP